MDSPTLDELIRGYKALEFSNHAHAIGHLCMQWSGLESTSDLFLHFLLDIKDPNIRAAVANNADQRDKWRMIDAVGFINRPDDDWYDRLNKLLNRIDHELRPERNRMVHDRWAAPNGEVIRLQPLGKVIKEQARRLAFTTGQPKPVPERDVWELVVDVSAASGLMSELIVEYLNARLPPDTSPEISE